MHADDNEMKLRRTSDDKVVNTRGRIVMQKLNACNMILLNGYNTSAKHTYHHTNGESVIDLIWTSDDHVGEYGNLEVWKDESECIGDHSLVTVNVTINQSSEARNTNLVPVGREKSLKSGWSREPNAG